jgi:hypothetical protein
MFDGVSGTGHFQCGAVSTGSADSKVVGPILR